MTITTGPRSLAADDHVTVPACLSHVVLLTQHYAEAREWYQTVLGAHISFDAGPLCFLTYDDEHHRIALADVGPYHPLPEAPRAFVDHIAFTYADLGDLLHNWRRLSAKGIDPVMCINHGPTTSMYYRDPDGQQLELQVENFATDDERNEFVASGTFSRNPFGVVFDPERLLQRYIAGDDMRALLRQDAAADQEATDALLGRLRPS